LGRAEEHLPHAVEALVGLIDVGLLGGEIGMGHGAQPSLRR
jgi:hypothetical protein